MNCTHYPTPTASVAIVASWGQDGPEHDHRSGNTSDAIIDRMQRRLDASDNPTDREVLRLKIAELRRRIA